MTQGTVVSRSPRRKKSTTEVGTTPEKLRAKQKFEKGGELTLDQVREKAREFGESLQEQADLKTLVDLESNFDEIPEEVVIALQDNLRQIQEVETRAADDIDEVFDREDEAAMIARERSEKQEILMNQAEIEAKLASRLEESENLDIREELKTRQEVLSNAVVMACESKIRSAQSTGETRQIEIWQKRLDQENSRREIENRLLAPIDLEVDLELLFGPDSQETPISASERQISRNEAFFVQMDNGEKGAMKPQLGESTKLLEEVGFPEGQKNLYRREWLAGQIDRVLGLDMIPPTVIRTDKNEQTGVGSVQQWQETDTQLMKEWEAVANPADLEKLALFDYLTGNIDRHKGNFTMDESGKVKGIDNGLTFLPREDLAPRSFAWDFVTREAVKKSGLTDPEDIYVKQFDLPRTELSADLKSLLSEFLSQDNFSTRRQLEKTFQAALDEKEGQANWHKFMNRAQDLLENGFPAYKYIHPPATPESKPHEENTAVGGPETLVGGFGATQVSEIAP
ncbi:hypothetical protein KKG19_03615 [Patescibacteria group bacterium]|nr:hypothetical protein [Patescibacteria group bacterium]